MHIAFCDTIRQKAQKQLNICMIQIPSHHNAPFLQVLQNPQMVAGSHINTLLCMIRSTI